MKKQSCFLVILFLLCAFGFPHGLAEKEENAWTRYAHEVNSRSEEAVELHIGLTYEPAASNPLLEQAFFLKYPHGRIVYHLYTEDQLNAYLMGNGNELDVLLVSDHTRQTLAQHGALRDLYTTELLSQWPDEWIDLRRQLEGEDGKLYGFPRSVEVGYMCWYDDLAKLMGIEKPGTLWTWDDFAGMATDTNYDMDGNGIRDFCLCEGASHTVNGMVGFDSTAMEVYTYQRVLHGECFDSPEFERLLNQFLAVYQSQALNPDGVAMFQGQAAQLITTMTEGKMGLMPLEGYSYVNFPTLYQDDPGYMGRSYVFALLNNAPHPDLALDFLRTALELCEGRISGDEIAAYINQAFPDVTVVCWGNSAMAGFAPNEKGEMVNVCQPGDYTLEAVTDFTDMLLQQDYTDYNFMRTHFIPVTGEWYRVCKVLYEMLPQYLSGSVTLNQITAAMDQRMRMMLNE